MDQLYVLRREISGYMLKGSGSFATPKLYKRGDALRVAKLQNAKHYHPDDGPVQVVPVTLVFGEPLDIV